jgi:hypothetical protein
LADYAKGPRRKLPPEVSVKIHYNDFPPDHHVIRDFLRYSHVLENAYLGVEQRNADARYLVRRKAGIAYDQEVYLVMASAPVEPVISRINVIRSKAQIIVSNVIARLIKDYVSSSDLKVEDEIAHLAVSLIVADAIVECEVLERPEDATTA